LSSPILIKIHFAVIMTIIAGTTKGNQSFMKRRNFLRLIAGMASVLSASDIIAIFAGQSSPPPLSQSLKVINRFPHDAQAFTQGLLYHRGYLYESTGGYGTSSLRMVELETGRVIKKIVLPRQYFAEGLALWGNRLIQLTWRSGIAFVYDLSRFQLIDSFLYTGEGWGLTHDDRQLIMSDGSNTLRRLDPDTYLETSRVNVFDGAKPVRMLNELEYIQDELWANIFLKDIIVRINPSTGNVVSWLDFSGEFDTQPRISPKAVFNGIAFDPDSQRLFVTGKLWPEIYEFRFDF
jgi:glutaminyl-peptide cyclotransferase